MQADKIKPRRRPTLGVVVPVEENVLSRSFSSGTLFFGPDDDVNMSPQSRAKKALRVAGLEEVFEEGTLAWFEERRGEESRGGEKGPQEIVELPDFDALVITPTPSSSTGAAASHGNSLLSPMSRILHTQRSARSRESSRENSEECDSLEAKSSYAEANLPRLSSSLSESAYPEEVYRTTSGEGWQSPQVEDGGGISRGSSDAGAGWHFSGSLSAGSKHDLPWQLPRTSSSEVVFRGAEFGLLQQGGGGTPPNAIPGTIGKRAR